MSAFIVDDETINRIVTWIESNHRSHIVGPEIKRAMNKYGIQLEGNMTLEMLGKMANSFLILNKLAVDNRYAKEHDVNPIKFVREFAPDIQVLKSMHCLRYQCSEGNVPEQPGFKLLEELIHILTDSIIDSLPEYEKAVWG